MKMSEKETAEQVEEAFPDLNSPATAYVKAYWEEEREDAGENKKI